MKTRRYTVVTAILLSVLSLWLVAQAHATESEIFRDTYSSWDTEEYLEVSSPAPTCNGTWINIQPSPSGGGTHVSKFIVRYCNVTFRVWQNNSVTQDTRFGLEFKWLNLTGTGDENSQIFFVLRGDGKIEAYTKNRGSLDTAIIGNQNTTIHIYTILWEPGRVRYYIDGVLKHTVTSDVPDCDMRLTYRRNADPGSQVWVDWVSVRQDREVEYDHPHIVGLNGTAYTGYGFNSSTLTWTGDLKHTSNYDLDLYLPLSYKNYFAEVKINGTTHTNVKFTRSSRELHVRGISANLKQHVTVKMVDPPEWLVDFSYWFMAATGFSLAPLLKIWDRLAKIHKLLPYLAIFLGLVFLCFAVWYTWQWISFQASHLRF